MIAKGSDSTTLEAVHNRYTDYDIAHQYLGINCIPEVIVSPLRKDNHPSCGIFLNRNINMLWFKDFGSGESGSIYELLARMWNMPVRQVYRRILEDSPVPVFLNNKSKTKIYRKSSVEVQVKTRQWKNYDLEYWESFGISEKWLKFGDIYPISHIIFTRKDDSYAIPADKYAYVYVERKDHKVTFKIYQPYSKDYKWMSKHDSSVWDLWTKIPETGERLIITSSRKDALCIWENTGIPCLSLQGEGYIPKEHVVQQLKERYNNIYVLYDNDFDKEDNPGRRYGKEIAERFSLIQIELPEQYWSKDSSDFIWNHGRRLFREIIFKLIKEKEL